MREILFYLRLMLLPAVLSAVLYFLTRGRRQRRLRAFGFVEGIWREVGLLLFVMFLAGLAALTLMPHVGWSGGRPVFFGMGGINLVPGAILKMTAQAASKGNWTSLLINLPGNILMFVPLGFFPALLWDRPRWWKSLLWAFSCSFFIEFIQLFVARGTDIDDLILNTVGGLAGYWIYRFLHRLAPGFSAKFRLKKVTSDGPESGDATARPGT